jgi:hypothetical protein
LVADKWYTDICVRDIDWLLRAIPKIARFQAAQQDIDLIHQWVGTVSSEQMEIEVGDISEDR